MADRQQVEFDNKLIEEVVTYLAEQYERTLNLIDNLSEQEWEAQYWKIRGERLGSISVIEDDGFYGTASESDILYIENVFPQRMRAHVEGLQGTLADLKIAACGSTTLERKLARTILKAYLKPYTDDVNCKPEWSHI